MPLWIFSFIFCKILFQKKKKKMATNNIALAFVVNPQIHVKKLEGVIECVTFQQQKDKKPKKKQK